MMLPGLVLLASIAASYHTFGQQGELLNSMQKKRDVAKNVPRPEFFSTSNDTNAVVLLMKAMKVPPGRERETMCVH